MLCGIYLVVPQDVGEAWGRGANYAVNPKFGSFWNSDALVSSRHSISSFAFATVEFDDIYSIEISSVSDNTLKATCVLL